MSVTQAPLVLVTGVSGFIASWVAHGALKLGYRVRGTVRSLENEAKVQHLRDLYPGSPYKIELVEADLLSETGWDAAVAGCDYILHLASPFVMAVTDPEELIRPAVDGTLNVLKAASRLSTPPKRVVVTSSVAAMYQGQDSAGKTFNDLSWTVPDDKVFPVGPYPMSKYLAEKAAWEFVEKLSADKKFELATINPTLVQGPMLSGSQCTSADIMKSIALKLMPALPDAGFGVVSVHAVARAHLLAMLLPDAAGKRFLVSNEVYTFTELSTIINDEFAPLGYTPTTTPPATKAFQKPIFDCANARNILKLDLQPDPTVVTQMVYAAIVAGFIPDQSAGETITKNYVVPELDVSDIPRARANNVAVGCTCDIM